MSLSLFTTLYVGNKVIVPGDAATIAHNIARFEGLFRAGIGIDILVFVSDVIIAWAFYELLHSVDSALARLGLFLRIADAAVLASVTLSGFITLRLVSGTDYLKAVGSQQSQGLARLFMSIRSDGQFIGFVFLGLGSTVFAYLLFKSRYVPRVLSGWGMFASPLLAIASLGSLLSPGFRANLSEPLMGPMFFYEVSLGLWFLIKGVRISQAVCER